MRPRRLAGVILFTLMALAVAGAFTYQPFATGSISAFDDRLLLDAGSVSPETSEAIPQVRYEFHASTSYYTTLSLRNRGPLAVIVLGINTDGALDVNPFVHPVELLTPSATEPYGVDGPESTTPLTAEAVEPNAEITLWIRWEIGPCEPPGVPAYMADSAVARSSIPLRWSVLGIPRSTTVELGYSVSFEVTPESLATECQPAVATREAKGATDAQLLAFEDTWHWGRSAEATGR
jgi:hypothetical protein